MERDGRISARDIDGQWGDPYPGRLEALGLQTTFSYEPTAGNEGKLIIAPSPFGGFGWNGEGIDVWLPDFLSSGRCLNKTNKLTRSGCAQRHLAIVLTWHTPAGLGIPLGLEALTSCAAGPYLWPTVTPGDDLTHLWLVSAHSHDGLAWSRNDGWGHIVSRTF